MWNKTFILSCFCVLILASASQNADDTDDGTNLSVIGLTVENITKIKNDSQDDYSIAEDEDYDYNYEYDVRRNTSDYTETIKNAADFNYNDSYENDDTDFFKMPNTDIKYNGTASPQNDNTSSEIQSKGITADSENSTHSLVDSQIVKEPSDTEVSGNITEFTTVSLMPAVDVDRRIVSRILEYPITNTDTLTITSDNFPDPYPIDATMYDWTVKVEETTGYGIEMIVKTIDFAKDDYLLIRPGGIDFFERQILFSWYMKSEKKYKLLHLNELYISFVVGSKTTNVNKGFRIDLRRLGEVTTTTAPTPTEPPPVTVAPQNESTIFLGGKTPSQFLLISEDFKMELAAISEKYCIENNITIDADINVSDNVVFHEVTQCFISWPDSSNCVKIHYSVGVHYDNETGTYEMSVEHMDDMWNMYGQSINWTRIGMHIYKPPNNKSAFWLWFGISLGVVIVFLAVLFAFWKCTCFSEYKQSPSMRESLVSQRKSDMSLFPTPHQTVPPLYGMDTYDDKLWSPEDEDVPPRYSGDEENFPGIPNFGFEAESNNLYSDVIFNEMRISNEQGALRIPDNGDRGGESIS